MHVAFNGWFWNQPYTGSGQYLQRLLTALNVLDPSLRLTLVVPDYVQKFANLPPVVDVLPIRTHFAGHVGKTWFEQRAFPQAIKRLDADIVHVPYWGPPFRSPAPLVCTVFDVIPLMIPAYNHGFGNRLYTSLVRATVRGATHVITISTAAQRDIVERIGIPPDRITVTHLAADNVFHPEMGSEHDESVRTAYGLDDVDSFVLYLGSYMKHKNLELLLAAYTYVAQGMGPGAPLVLAGHKPAVWGTALVPDLPATIDELGLGDYVRWIGPVDEADKPALYRLADVFAFPSLYEGFGLGILEAMASGTPVVACQASAVPEVAGNAAFLIDPADSRAFGGAILSLLSQPDHAATMRNQGLARARDFSWRKTAEETLDIYARVCRS